MNRIPRSTVLSDLQESFRDVWASLAPWAGGNNVDLNGRRLINAGQAVSESDYATLGQIRALVTGPLAAITRSAQTGGMVTYGSHNSRLAASPEPDGALFVETNRGNALYQAQNVSGAPSWVYIGGNPFSTNTFLIDLGTNDTGFLLHWTAFNRNHIWTGSAWTDGPHAPARQEITFFRAAPVPSAGWQLCDGTAGVTLSAPDGTTSSITVPSMVSAKRFLRSHSAFGATGGAATTHTHSVDPPDTTSGNNSANVVVAAGVGTTVAADPHTHNTDIGSFTSGTPSGTSGDDALPPYIEALPYIRL